MARLPVALLGAGRLGAGHARILAALPEAQLVAVADPRPEGRQLGERYGARTIADPLEAIGDAAVRAVVIATPTSSHAPLIEAAARAGKAIFCEKPVALDVASTARALAAVRAGGVQLQLGFQRRFDAGFAEARRRIAAGEIGKIQLLHAVSCDPYPPSREYILGCGGQFVDMAIHDIDMARFLTASEISSVSASGAALGPQAEDFRAAHDWDTTVLTLRFASGALGTIVNSRQAGYGYDIHTAVLGDSGGLKVGYERHTPITRYDQGGAHHDYVPYFPERFAQAYAAELETFVEAVRWGRDVSPTGDDGLLALQVALAATASARAGGQPVTVDYATDGDQPAA
ncbi:MAG TPA: Gfo/Idh/MocA family oxidoreductase [Chloroflexota bacterium]|nr:Gfo/Idh/MocA family oxidoreductase [Chloroflexota bacterium]